MFAAEALPRFFLFYNCRLTVLKGKAETDPEVAEFYGAAAKVMAENEASTNKNVNYSNVDATLKDGITELNRISNKITKRNKTISFEGIKIEEANNAYFDAITGKGKTDTAALKIVECIDQTIGSGNLKPKETARLQKIKAEMEPYVENVMGGVVEFGGVQAKTILNFVPNSGVELKATPGKTTTIIGTYADDIRSIIDEVGTIKSIDFGPRDGSFNLLNTPNELYITKDQFWKEYNKLWLDKAIERGDIIILATKPTTNALYRFNKETGLYELSGFGREYNYLLEQGYTYDSANMRMIPKQ